MEVARPFILPLRDGTMIGLSNQRRVLGEYTSAEYEFVSWRIGTYILRISLVFTHAYKKQKCRRVLWRHFDEKISKIYSYLA